MTLKRRPSRQSPAFLLAAVLLVAILAVIFLTPLMPFYEPHTRHLGSTLLPPGGRTPDGVPHLLGTDNQGRDILSRISLGGRTSLQIGFLSVLLSLLIGPLLGAIAGYFGGLTDRLISASVDLQLALPRVLIIIAIVAIFRPSVTVLVLTFGLTGWILYARVVRSLTMSMREREFVAAARTFGAGSPYILRRHIMPNVLGPIVVMASLDLGRVIMVESALSYLGVGVQPPNTTWGLMISVGQSYMRTDPWFILIPGVFLTCLIVSLSLVSRILTGEEAMDETSTTAAGV